MMACFSYLDDLSLAVPMDAAGETRNIVVARLGQVGLRLNLLKCWFFGHILRNHPKGMEDWWEEAERQDGLLNASRQFCAEADGMVFDFGGGDQVFPVGETSFVAALAKHFQDKITEALHRWYGKQDRQRASRSTTVWRPKQHISSDSFRGL